MNSAGKAGRWELAGVSARGSAPGGRPPCAGGLRRSGRTPAAVPLAGASRPPARRAPALHHVLFPVALSRGDGRAIGARRAPRAFKDVLKLLTDLGTRLVRLRLMCDTVASLDARHSRNASGVERGRAEVPGSA